MIDYAKGILVSKRVFEFVIEEIDYLNEGGAKLSGYIDTFVNCRETGFYLTLYDTNYDKEDRQKDNLFIWAFESRNSDDIVVIYQTKYPSNEQNLFSEEAYSNNNRHFRYDEEHKASDYIIEIVKDYFKINK